MNKKKAILIIQEQINKLESSEENRSNNWVIETRTYIESFFGKDSRQDNYFYHFSWTRSPNDTDIELKQKRTINFLNDCINTIINLGLHKPPVDNWFSKLPNSIISLGLPSLCFISFSFGILFTNNNNAELRNENKKLNEKLLLISSDTIPNQVKKLSSNPK